MTSETNAAEPRLGKLIVIEQVIQCPCCQARIPIQHTAGKGENDPETLRTYRTVYAFCEFCDASYAQKCGYGSGGELRPIEPVRRVTDRLELATLQSIIDQQRLDIRRAG